MTDDTIEFDWEDGRSPAELIERLDELVTETRSSLEGAMQWAVLKIEADAKKYAPVDTGRLRSDINSAVERIYRDTVKGMVGNNVDYAPYQEFISNPYLEPAIEKNIEEIRQHFEDVLREVFDEVSRT